MKTELMVTDTIKVKIILKICFTIENLLILVFEDVQIFRLFRTRLWRILAENEKSKFGTFYNRFFSYNW